MKQDFDFTTYKRSVALKSKAAIVAQHGQPMVIDEVEYGDPGADQVLVKLFASGICHSQQRRMRRASTD